MNDDGRVGGGILVYARNGLPFHAQPQLDKVDLEVLWLLYRRPLVPREEFAHFCRRCLLPSLSPKWTDVRSPRFNYGHRLQRTSVHWLYFARRLQPAS